MWFTDDAEHKARKDFARALHAYADGMPDQRNSGRLDPRQTWNYIADEIDKGTEEGVSFYGVLKDTLKLPQQTP